MAPRLICCLCVALGMAFLAFLAVRAEAGERRFATANPEMGIAKRAVAELNAAAHAAHSVNHAPEVASLTFAKTTATPSTRAETAKEPDRNEAPGKRKTITFFRFSNSKVGEVSVQPVVGRVNGAQLSIGF